MGINPKLEKELKKKGVTLRKHQLQGLEVITKWWDEKHGGIVADEMGLGKTAQCVVHLTQTHMAGAGPFLVIGPLSISAQWEKEIALFSAGKLTPVMLSTLHMPNRHAKIEELLDNMPKNTVIYTHYQTMLKDDAMIGKLHKKYNFSAVVIDEAQRVKNSLSQLHEKTRMQLPVSSTWYLLMTGTPVQNNLGELYSLLTYIDSQKYPAKPVLQEAFQKKYTSDLPGLKAILAGCMIRRTKDQVMKDLPPCKQVIMYTGMTRQQTTLYLNLLSRNLVGLYGSAATAKKGSKMSLVNVLMQCRKAVIHPYLLEGQEPEPFTEGEHLVDASGKLLALDSLFAHFAKTGHRCLVFSQYVIALDIVQDYLEMRDYKYVRLDGSVKNSTRFELIDSFQKGDKDAPTIFLITTKAGGVGLTLTQADTVVFLDSDWNPQNDLQAMARCHRIGQDKPVRVIRLVTRYTVEQYMQAKARKKLQLTENLMNEKDLDTSAIDLHKLKKIADKLTQDVDDSQLRLTSSQLERIIGRTDDKGHWMDVEANGDDDEELEAIIQDIDKTDSADVGTDGNYHLYKGKDYSMTAKEREEWEHRYRYGHLDEKRQHVAVVDSREQQDIDDFLAPLSPLKTRKQRRKSDDSDTMMAAGPVVKKRKALAGYVSTNLPEEEEDMEEEMEEEAGPSTAVDDDEMDLRMEEDEEEGVMEKEQEEEQAGVFHIAGDVTRPTRGGGHALILHAVDDAGVFGRGGLFTALRRKDERIPEMYEKAARKKDVHLGDAHLLADVREEREQPVKQEEEVEGDGQEEEEEQQTGQRRRESVALLVLQPCERRSEISVADLETAFRRVSIWARRQKAAIHMPRIGERQRELRDYVIERLLRKHFVYQGVSVFVYHFRRPAMPLYTPAVPAAAPVAAPKTPRPPLARLPLATRNRSPSPPARFVNGKRLRGRRPEKKVVEDRTEDEEESASDMSSGESSESEEEQDWEAEEADSEEESEGDMDEDDEQENDTPEGSPVKAKKTPGRMGRVATTDTRWQQLVAGPSLTADRRDRFKGSRIFDGQTVSIWDLDYDMQVKLRALINVHDGYTVDEEGELMEATHAIVPEGVDEDNVEQFKALFREDVVFVHHTWVQECIDKGQLLD